MSIRFQCAFLVVPFLFACGCRAEPASTLAQDGSCLSVVAQYVSDTRNWSEADYDVLPEVVEEGVNGYSILYRRDLDVPPPVQLKSFHVDLDERCSKVVRELAYQ